MGAMTVAAYLLLMGSPAESRVYPLSDQRTLVGRDPECHLRLVYPTVSRTHCEIWAEDGKSFVQDLKSANGTYVNAVRVRRRRLDYGDLVQVGPLIMQVTRAHPAHEKVFSVGDEDVDTRQPLQPAVVNALTGLSPQEVDVVRSLVDGNTEKEVAAALKISRHSVHSQVKSLYQRLGISSRAELSAWYWRGGKSP